MISRKSISQLPVIRLILSILAATLAACGGGGGGPTVPPVVTVVNDYDVALAAENVVAGSTATGTATAVLSHNTTDGLVEITLSPNGVTVTSASLRRAYAGDQGAEIYPLQQNAVTNVWSLASQPFTAADATDLQNGALYILVSTATYPDGALRGQVLPSNVEVARIELAPADITAGSSSTGSGIAWLTIHRTAGTITAHARVQSLPDVDGGTIRGAIAGLDGPVLETLEAHTASPAHWLLSSKPASAELLDAYASGELYVQFTTPALADGAIRGQHLPSGMELVRTEVRDDSVVMGTSASPSVGTVGRLMTTIDGNTLSSVLNLFTIADSTSVELRQAPAGQNGPVIAAFVQDPTNPDRWSIGELAIDGVLQANLDNRTLYVSVATSSAPGGAGRGQIETFASAPPVDSSAFIVVMTDPPNADTLDSLPADVFVTLNREPLPTSVTPQAVSVESSGQDGSFGDGNEVPIVPAAVMANGNTIEISLAGTMTMDDVYRVSVNGGGSQGIVDMSGIALDGDNDGQAGGLFESAFEVEQPTVTATLTQIQNEIFTPTCAGSGCHSGSNPPDGLLLTAGNSWSNIVNVDAVQIDLKRILPGDPDDSYLVRKVQGTGIVANRMPLGGPALSNEEVELIRQWVEDGAPNN